MYRYLKKILIVLSSLFIVALGLWFIEKYQSEMFAGEQELVSVQQANINLKLDIEKIAKDKQVLIAKRIAVSKNNQSGELQNTYIKIGNGNLPKGLPLQNDGKIIKNSPDATMYVIIGKGLTAEELSQKLNALGNKSGKHQNNHSLILLRLLMLVPQAAIGLILLLFSFASLIIADYISGMKAVGLKRLAGESKHRLAFRGIVEDGKFIFALFGVLLLFIVGFLFVRGTFSSMYIMLIMLPLALWLFFLLFTSFWISQLIYYVLQNQPIHLSVKGKAPLGAITVFVIAFQIFSIFASVYSVSGLVKIEKELDLLRNGQEQWSKNREYYSLSSIGYESKYSNDFIKELYESSDTLYASNNFELQVERKGAKVPKGTGGYFPSPYGGENMLTVNKTFIDKSGIVLSDDLKQKINNLGKHEYVLLIPESQKSKAQELEKVWKENLQGRPSLDDNGKTMAKLTQISGIYQKGEQVFGYPMFHEAGQINSNQAFAHYPLIVVYSPLSFYGAVSSPWQIFVTDPDKTKSLIHKYQMEHNIGALTNGYYSTNSRILFIQAQKTTLILANIFSGLSSSLLVFLLNTIYLYQNRRKFLIERLSGKGLLEIHAKYLSVVTAVAILIELISIFLQLTWFVLLVPVIYLLLVYLLFTIQVNRDKKANILYLKGE